MASQTTQLIVELLDRVSGPARGVANSLRGLTRTVRDATSAPITMADRLDAAITRNNRALDAARGRMLDAVGTLYVLKSAFTAPVQAAQEFDRALAEIGAKGDLTKEQMTAIGDAAKVTSSQMNQFATDIVKAQDFLVGIRRPLLVDAPQRVEIKVVQQQLKDLGYFEVGMVDGRYGPRMRAAILAFRADNGLGLSPDVDPVLVEALQRAKPRAVSRERAEGKPAGSRIVKAADAKIATGIVGVAGAAASVVVPAIETAERAKDVTERTVGLLNLTDWLLPVLPWAGAAIFLIVILLAWKAKAARIEDYRTGKTP